MKQLHPRAIWLFFIGYLLRWFIVWVFMSLPFINIILFMFIAPTPLVKEVEKAVIIIPLGVGSFIVLSIIFVVALYIWARLSYHYYRYELTDREFRKEYGVIWKKYVSIPYNRIQNVDIYRGLVARLLGLSELHIQTAGVGGLASKWGKVFTEGRLPGLTKEEAEKLREELINRASQHI